MSNTYNQVKPIILGKSLKQKMKNDQATNQKSHENNQIINPSTTPFLNAGYPGIPSLPNIPPTLMGGVGMVPQPLPNPVRSMVLPGPNSATQNLPISKSSFPNPTSNLIKKKKGKKGKKGFKSYTINPSQPPQYSNKSNIFDFNSMNDDSIDSEKKRRRAEKFGTSSTDSKKPKISTNSNAYDEDEDYSNLNAISSKSNRYDKDKPVVGRCTTLEKSYLRLTSEPNPDLVRPLHILKQSFDSLMKRHTSGSVSYTYVCDQFKAIRQDLRVQMIDNQFTLKVYETHARIALENSDIGEFNQCQSRISTLFEIPSIKPSYQEEFIYYKILYYILTEDNGSLNSLRLTLIKNSLALYKNKMVQIAFKLADAKVVGDYHSFVKIAKLVSGLGKKLLELFIDKERMKTLLVISKSYNQANLSLLCEELYFNTIEDVANFFVDMGLNNYIITKNSGLENEYKYLDTRSSRAFINQKYNSMRKIDIKGQQ
ncbi:hypothetical protein TBLA_0F02620 [Henningerozyma blattae CBS 6284]|uniref:PCI domain-containing protein n=1 Tax=Henningerozyma blattae (strain ATCC 34711 / CBS 6284 / DSM 70876 / NBRC 10599 / NRRL Y-10934 / UCD 77-7) TaxID=1071380 RepID=I2H5Z9_HENB6|nr:hypothetical protein TBLA_0F02620 [Tetrapisispora blattae CBS 6284]CCH61801.1 hypothetical protein TBLA_0F02620 [Tetrapisispora blattae CBS 6284]